MSETIVVFDVVEIEQAPAGTYHPRDPVRGGEPTRASKPKTALQAVDVELMQLGGNLVGFVNQISGMLAKVAEHESKFQVEKVEVQAQVNAEGKVGFMGTGAKAGGGASLELTLERREQTPTRTGGEG